MKPALSRLLVSIALACAASLPPAASAGPVGDDDARSIRAVIAAQFEAFAQDDAERAFQTATPAVREAIGSPGMFLALVRGAYPMVYHPSTVTFHKPEEDRGTVMQLVEITDDDAKSWIALFAMERQPDASWRISGCAVAENPWRAI